MRIATSRVVVVSAVALALAAGWSAFSASKAPAQPAAPALSQAPFRIAIANPAHIFNSMAETKALQAEMAEEQRKFQAASKDKMDAITDLKTKRDALNPEHPQWTELNTQLATQTAEYRVWGETQKVIAETGQKTKMKALFKKIEDAAGEIAKRDGIDLVIADNREPLPPSLDEIDVRTLRNFILARDVVFASDRMDISQEVITLLDAKYRGVAANK